MLPWARSAPREFVVPTVENVLPATSALAPGAPWRPGQSAQGAKLTSSPRGAAPVLSQSWDAPGTPRPAPGAVGRAQSSGRETTKAGAKRAPRVSFWRSKQTR